MAIRGKRLAIPVIAVPGGMRTAPMDFLPLAKKFGAKKVLYKPIEINELLVAVKELLSE